MSETMNVTKIQEVMSNRQIVDALNGLHSFIQKDVSVPYKLNRAICKNRKALMEEYTIYSEALEKLKQEHLDESKQPEFVEKVTALLKETAEVPIIMVDESVFEGVEMSIKDRMALDFMVEE